MILERLPYILAVMFLFMENMFVGNFTACKERGISKIPLSTKVKKILFPFCYLKRITYITLVYQMITCIFSILTLGGLLLMGDDFRKVFQLYWNFEKYYIFFAPILLYLEWYWINTFGLIRKRRRGVSWVPKLLQEMSGEIYKISDTEVTVVKPADVNGCVFIMLENVNPYITDVFYKNILCKLFDMNYMLVCIDKFPSNDLEKYIMIIKETIQFFHVSEKPFFYMGCEVVSIYETLKIDYVFKLRGMIWLCALKRKNVMKNVTRSLRGIRYEEIIPADHDVCVLNACMKDAEQNLAEWIKEREGWKKFNKSE